MTLNFKPRPDQKLVLYHTRWMSWKRSDMYRNSCSSAKTFEHMGNTTNDKNKTPFQIYEEKTLKRTKRNEVLIGELNQPKPRRQYVKTRKRWRSDNVTSSFKNRLERMNLSKQARAILPLWRIAPLFLVAFLSLAPRTILSMFYSR